jgi:ferredoxin
MRKLTITAIAAAALALSACDDNEVVQQPAPDTEQPAPDAVDECPRADGNPCQ